MSNPSNVQSGQEQLQSCLRMLQNASNDNEKMAGLLLFTHLMKTNNALTVDANELFKAVDVKFLVRLLNSTNVPEGCSGLMYKSLALNILSSFTDYTILCHPLLLSNLSSIVEVLLMDKNFPETTQMFEDTTVILLILSRKPEGCNQLLKLNCIPIICKAVIQSPALGNLFDILKGVLLHFPQQLWAQNGSELSMVFELFSRQFTDNQDLLKFSACENVLALLLSLCESQVNVTKNNIFLPKWKDDIRRGLNDILQARCKAEYKYTAIKLTRYMIELFGIDWTVDSEDESVLDVSHTKFWLIALSIIKTEIRIILEDGRENEIESKSDFIVSSYVIIEKTIEFLICDKEQGWSFSDNVILKMHSILTETFDGVIQFLIQLDLQDAIKESPVFQRPIVVATVRVLCAWLSEETNVLSDKISTVLPVLVKWAKLDQSDVLSSNNSTSNEILLHLLPPLCHLSADESFCVILVKEDCHILLTSLFKQLWQKQQAEKVDYPSHLVTLCNVFLNFSVLEVELIKTSKAFQEILEFIMVCVPQTVSSTLKAHFILLGLILFRHRFQLDKTLTAAGNEFILNSVSFIKQVYLSLTTEESSCLIDWHSMSELWFLSVQNLVACAKTMQAVKSLVLASGWPKEIQLWMNNSNESSNSLFEDLKSALLPISNLE